MPQESPTFRILQKQIAGPPNDDRTLLGVVKIQMPQQCGRDFKIRRTEKARNLSLVQNAVARFGNWGRDVGAPAIVLFPEFSISTEALRWLLDRMSSDQIAPNTLIVFGLEQITTKEFMNYVAESDSKEDFDGDFGPNINLINTAVILAKDHSKRVTTYFQPKCSRSDYELARQYVSRTVNLIKFGPYESVVSICSDFLLNDDNGQPLLGQLLQDIEGMYDQPRDHSLDLVFLIQNNPSPLHDLYDRSIRYLRRNRPHHLVTTDTIICAVNAIELNAPSVFGRCNVSVMNRGRSPKDRKRAAETYAWRLFEDPHHDLRYITWRLRSPGAISFVLDTDRRPWQLGDPSVPIRTSGLHQITATETFADVIPIPEVYEIQEVLYDNSFQAIIGHLFHVSALTSFFLRVREYELLISRLFVKSPAKIIKLLLTMHGQIPDNCDQWNIATLKEAFTHFFLTLRLLAIRYPDLQVDDDYFSAQAHTLGVVDCNGRVVSDIVDELWKPNPAMGLNILVLQRVSKLFRWDGRPTTLDSLKNLLSINGTDEMESRPESVARVPSPHVVHIGTVVDDLNRRCRRSSDIRSVLNEVLQFE